MEFIAPISGGIAALVMFVIIQSNGWFSGMLFQFFWFKDKADMVDPGIGSIAGFITTADIVTAIAFFLHPQKTSEALLKERANELISRITPLWKERMK